MVALVIHSVVVINKMHQLVVVSPQIIVNHNVVVIQFVLVSNGVISGLENITAK